MVLWNAAVNPRPTLARMAFKLLRHLTNQFIFLIHDAPWLRNACVRTRCINRHHTSRYEPTLGLLSYQRHYLCHCFSTSRPPARRLVMRRSLAALTCILGLGPRYIVACPGSLSCS